LYLLLGFEPLIAGDADRAAWDHVNRLLSGLA
jgi:hypothetical protein